MNEKLEDRIIKKLDLIYLDPEKARFIHPSSGIGSNPTRGSNEGNYAEMYQGMVFFNLRVKGVESLETILQVIDQALELIKKAKAVEEYELNHPLFEKQLEARFYYLYQPKDLGHH